jgi:hypothetical protein
VDLEREAAGGANGVAAASGTSAWNIAATEGTSANVCFHYASLLYCRVFLVILMDGAVAMAAAARDDGIAIGSHA